MGRKSDPMTTDQTEAIRLIQSGLNRLGHSPGTIDGLWGLRTARAIKALELTR